MRLMKTRIIKINPRKPEKRRIEVAANEIRKGNLVIFPTETVYGIGADAFDSKAVKQIYVIKGRPAANPIMLHVSGLEMASRIGNIPTRYKEILQKVWPGPLAIVVNAKKTKGRQVAMRLPERTIAMRMPSNKVALELIKASKTPIAAPSANISKKPSATSAKHAIKYFYGKVPVIIDSGHSSKGIESTIIDLRTFKLLRPGAYPAERIEKEFGRKPIITDATRGLNDSQKAIAPGMKYRHYSPDTPLFLYTGKAEKLGSIVTGIRKRFCFIGSHESCMLVKKKASSVIDLGSRSSTDQIAKNLFDGLIRLDRLNVEFAIIEQVNEHGIGLGVMNRIRKASNRLKFSTRSGLESLIDKS